MTGSNGKGDKPRKINKAEYDKNYKRIFSDKKDKKNVKDSKKHR